MPDVVVVKDHDGAGCIEVPWLCWAFLRALELSIEEIASSQHKKHRESPIHKGHIADSLCRLPVLLPESTKINNFACISCCCLIDKLEAIITYSRVCTRYSVRHTGTCWPSGWSGCSGTLPSSWRSESRRRQPTGCWPGKKVLHFPLQSFFLNLPWELRWSPAFSQGEWTADFLPVQCSHYNYELFCKLNGA